MVELPVEWILDDAVYVNPRGASYSPPRDVLQVFIDEFDKAYEEGTMFFLTMHPHYIGHRSRIAILEELIDYIRARIDARPEPVHYSSWESRANEPGLGPGESLRTSVLGRARPHEGGTQHLRGFSWKPKQLNQF